MLMLGLYLCKHLNFLTNHGRQIAKSVPIRSLKSSNTEPNKQLDGDPSHWSGFKPRLRQQSFIAQIS